MGRKLEGAEQELIELYTEKALNAYQAGKLAEAARCAQRILAYDPEDVNALFLKGATIGRSSKPGDMHIYQAFQVWIPLMERVTGEQRLELLGAIRYAFAVMTETPVMLGFRFWSSYYNLSTITNLRDVLQELTDLERTLPRTKEQKQWILPLLRKTTLRGSMISWEPIWQFRPDAAQSCWMCFMKCCSLCTRWQRKCRPGREERCFCENAR